MVTIDPRDLQAAQDRDNAMGPSLLASSPTVSPVGAFTYAGDQARDVHA